MRVMKICIILMFLIVSTFKEKETCKTTEQQKTPWLVGGGQKNQKKLFRGITPAGPNGIPDTESAWWRDHEILLHEEPDDGDLSPTSNPDRSILAMKEKVDAFVETDSPCPAEMYYEEYYNNKSPGKPLNKSDNWNRFYAEISNCYMYPEGSGVVDSVMTDMANMTIDSVENFKFGSQMKFKIKFANGRRAIFKPMRVDHNYEKNPNEYYADEFEKPNAEVAAFHLDRLLGFRRAIPTTLRELSIENDLKAKYKKPDDSDESDEERNYIKFFTSPANNLCFFGNCAQYCDTAHAICSRTGKIQGSVQAWLTLAISKRKVSPFARVYLPDKFPRWKFDAKFNCNNWAKKQPQFVEGRRLLDLVDLSVFDFITGNQDRHSYEHFTFFDKNENKSETNVIALDNGRGFGDPHNDDEDILAPLIQCCNIRRSTVRTLLNFYTGKTTLAQALEKSLKDDYDRPVLANKYLVAVNRRVEKALLEMVKCINQAGGDLSKVLMNKRTVNVRKMISTNSETPLKDESSSQQYTQGYRAARMAVQRRTFQDTAISMRNNRPADADPPPNPEINESLTRRLREIDEFVELEPACPDERTYEKFHKEKSKTVQSLMDYMATQAITKVESIESDSQMKMKITYKTGEWAIFKPTRFGRYYETNPDHFYTDDFERPHAEIAAFHLDRLLGFRRALPTVGRVLSIQDDTPNSNIGYMEFFDSPAGTRCIYDKYGGCYKYCDSAHAICGNKENLLQGSVQVWLGHYTETSRFEISTLESPYHKTLSTENYTLTSKQTDMDFCDSTLKETEPFNQGRRLLDLVDLYIFDFLTGNQDRDHYTIFHLKKDDPNAFIAFTENAKGFGSPDHDDSNTLAPLTQCCIVRPSTVKTLFSFYTRTEGNSLAQALHESLKDDRTFPVLATKYLKAVDRRVGIVLDAVANCTDKLGLNRVLTNSFRLKM